MEGITPFQLIPISGQDTGFSPPLGQPSFNSSSLELDRTVSIPVDTLPRDPVMAFSPEARPMDVALEGSFADSLIYRGVNQAPQTAQRSQPPMSFTFGAKGAPTVNSPTSLLQRSCGFVQDPDVKVPDEYLVTIASTFSGKVISLMQDKTSLAVTSQWVPLIDFSNHPMFDNLNKILQVFRRSPVVGISSRRIWQGTSPVELVLTLKFEAVYNAFNEVICPNIKLQQMALPSLKGSIDLPGGFTVPLLSPPGPTPYRFSDPGTAGPRSQNLVDQITSVLTKDEDRIVILIGRYLVFDNVIIKDVNVEYENRLNTEGQPISAKTTVTFQTYEILTKEKLERAYIG